MNMIPPHPLVQTLMILRLHQRVLTTRHHQRNYVVTKGKIGVEQMHLGFPTHLGSPLPACQPLINRLAKLKGLNNALFSHLLPPTFPNLTYPSAASKQPRRGHAFEC